MKKILLALALCLCLAGCDKRQVDVSGLDFEKINSTQYAVRYTDYCSRYGLDGLVKALGENGYRIVAMDSSYGNTFIVIVEKE